MAIEEGSKELTIQCPVCPDRVPLSEWEAHFEEHEARAERTGKAKKYGVVPEEVGSASELLTWDGDANKAMHGVWWVLNQSKDVPVTFRNVFWSEFVAAWNRRGLLNNDEAGVLNQIRFNGPDETV